MKYLLLIPILFTLKGCGIEAKASDEDPKAPHMTCKFLDAWDFKRCETSEVICYTNDVGLSCKWKD